LGENVPLTTVIAGPDPAIHQASKKRIDALPRMLARIIPFSHTLRQSASE